MANQQFLVHLSNYRTKQNIDLVADPTKQQTLNASIADEILLTVIISLADAGDNNNFDLLTIELLTGAVGVYKFPTVAGFTSSSQIPLQPFFSILKHIPTFRPGYRAQNIEPFQIVNNPETSAYAMVVNQIFLRNPIVPNNDTVFVMQIPFQVLNGKQTNNNDNHQFKLTAHTNNDDSSGLIRSGIIHIIEPLLLLTSSTTAMVPTLPGSTVTYLVTLTNGRNHPAYNVVMDFAALKNTDLFASLQIQIPPGTAWVVDASQPYQAYLPHYDGLFVETFTVTAIIQPYLINQNLHFQPEVTVRWNSQPPSPNVNQMNDVNFGRNGSDGVAGLNNYFVVTQLQEIVLKAAPQTQVEVLTGENVDVGENVAVAFLVTLFPGVYGSLTITTTVPNDHLQLVSGEFITSPVTGLFQLPFNYTAGNIDIKGGTLTLTDLVVNNAGGYTFAWLVNYVATSVGTTFVTATIDYTDTTPFSVNSTPIIISAVSVLPPILTVSKFLQSITQTATTRILTYGIQVTNVGGSANNAATLTDVVPLGTTATQGAWSSTTGSITQTIQANTIAAGTSKVFPLTLTVPNTFAGDVVNNQVTVASGINVNSDYSTFTLPPLMPTPPVVLIAKKVVTATNFVAGVGTIIYTLLIQNMGTEESVQGIVTDQLPLNTSVVAGSGNWTGVSGTIFHVLPPIPAGMSVQIPLTVFVGFGLAGITIINTASAAAGSTVSNTATAAFTIPLV
jgi:uncharacterized repeat protein (TIGR01451 family)